MRTADPSFEPARPVLPGHVRAHRYGDAVPLIDDPNTRRVADLFNVANEVMLLALTRFFAHTDETPEQLRTLESIGVGLMFAAIKPIGQLLTTLPFGPSAPGRTAGPTFELFYIGGYLLPHRDAAWTLIAERLRQAAALATRIEADGIALRGVVAGLEKYAAKLELR